MRPKRFLPASLFLTGLALSSGLPMARAATLYWDGSSTGPDADGGAGSWNTASAHWDTAPTGGSDVAWTNGSNAVFGGTGGSVGVGSTVTVGSLFFQSPGYSVSGGFAFSGPSSLIATGANDVSLNMSFAGTSWITKTGTGRLDLSAAGFTGSFAIAEGTVSAGGSAFGPVIYISPGATLEAFGSFSGKRASIEGAGVGGAGAIVNNLTSTVYLDALNLTGPATLGGTGPMEIGFTSGNTPPPIQLESNTLTKVGSNEVRLKYVIGSPGNIDVQSGTFWLDNPGSNQIGGSTPVLTIRSGAQFRQSTGTYTEPWTAVFESGSIWRGSGRWDGPVTLQGAITLNSTGGITHHGVISGPGSVTKTGNSLWTVNSLSTFSGGTTISAGKLILSGANTSTGAGSLTGSISLANGTALEITKAGALGSAPGTRVSPLSATGAIVETKAAGADVFEVVNLTRGTLRSNAGVASPDAAGHFVFGSGGILNVLAADTASLISGRLDLGTGVTPAALHVEDGSAARDLDLQAAITEGAPGRGLLKTGGGLVLLDGPASHTGGTVIQEGTLRLGFSGMLASSPVTVAGGGGFGTGVPGKTFASLTAGNAATLILPATLDSTTTVEGTLDLTEGEVVIAPVLGGDAAPGIYDLATATAITGSGTPVLDFTAAFGPTRATGSVAVNGNKLQLTLTSAGGNLVWNNASAAGAADGIWDTTLANFSLDGNNTAFQTYDSVTFDDTVAPGSAKTITLGSSLVPALVTVDNSNGNYTFTGIENLTGMGALLKTGASTLTIGGTGSYPLTGDITVAGGTLDFSAKSVLMDKLTLSGGTFNNATATFNSAEFRSGSANAVLTGSAPWTKTTPGTVILSEANLLTGPGTVAEGTLIVGNSTPSSKGSLGTGPVHVATGAAVDFRRSSGSVTIPNIFSGTGTVILTGVISSNVFSYFPSSEFRLSADQTGFSGSFHLVDSKLVPAPAPLGVAGVTLSGNSYLALQNQVFPNAVSFAHTAPAVSTLALQASTQSGPVFLSGSGTARIHTSGNATLSGSIQDSAGAGNVSFAGDYPASSFSTANHLTLSGNSSHTGATTVTDEGVLDLTGSLGATAVTVNGTGTLGGTGSIGAGGSLTFQEGGRLWVKPTGDVLTVNGDVDLGTGTKVVVDFATIPPRGPFPVLEHTGNLTGGAAELGIDPSTPVRQSVFAFPPGLITLDIGSKTLIWKGESHNKWQPGTAANWNTDGTGETDSYYDGDSVTFDDTGTALSISGNNAVVRPAATLFDNIAKNYSVSVLIGGSGTITKRGTGRVALATASHSGGTFIEAGILAAGALGTGPVNVSTGAFLTGNPIIPAAFTCAGTLDPGSSVGSTGSVTSGPAVFSGIYECLLGSSISDSFTVNGDLDLTGSTLALTRPASTTAPVESYTILTYTGTLVGTFTTVTGMPDDFELIHDAANKKFAVSRLRYSHWTDSFAGLADPAPDADPDGDGFPSLTEYVLGGDPGTGDTSIMPTHELTGSDFIFRYKRRDSSIFDTTQVVQWSADMVTWRDITVRISGGGPDYIVRNGDLPDDVSVYIDRPSGQKKVFARLKVIPK